MNPAPKMLRAAANVWHDDQLPTSEMLHYSQTGEVRDAAAMLTEVLDGLYDIYSALETRLHPKDVAGYTYDARCLEGLVVGLWDEVMGV
jgi:hypothetical protein